MQRPREYISALKTRRRQPSPSLQSTYELRTGQLGLKSTDSSFVRRSPAKPLTAELAEVSVQPKAWRPKSTNQLPAALRLMLTGETILRAKARDARIRVGSVIRSSEVKPSGTLLALTAVIRRLSACLRYALAAVKHASPSALSRTS